MSKSLGNYVGLSQDPKEVYTRVMSIPDDLMEQYFNMLTELETGEWAQLQEHLKNGTLAPQQIKRVLAADIVAAIHGKDAAGAAAEYFTERFSKGNYMLDAQDLAVEGADVWRQVAAGVGISNKQLVRFLGQNGVSIIGADGEKYPISTTEQLDQLSVDGTTTLKVGKKVLRLVSA